MSRFRLPWKSLGTLVAPLSLLIGLASWASAQDRPQLPRTRTTMPHQAEAGEEIRLDSATLVQEARANDGRVVRHSVALVGYGEGKEFPGGGYFIFRNSWGPEWGDEGYGYMPFDYVLKYANDLVVYLDPAEQPAGAKPAASKARRGPR
jgi:hypothetical protein